MRSIRRGSAAWLSLLFCTLLIAIDARQTPPTAAPTATGQGAQPDSAGRGGRGTGGLPPMNPIDENAPPPPLVTPAASPGDPPSDAVMLFDGTDLSKWTLRDWNEVLA